VSVRVMRARAISTCECARDASTCYLEIWYLEPSKAPHLFKVISKQAVERVLAQVTAL